MQTFPAPSTLLSRTVVVASVLAAALAAWIVSFERMRGMDAGPGTDLGSFGWFVGIWTTMTVAMMLPSAAPATLLFSRLGAGAARTALFVAGYVVAWTSFGIAVYGAGRAARGLAPSFVAWNRGGPWIAGAALAGAGLYQLTPLKTACLRHCRSPLHFFARPRRGPFGMVQAGLGHGSYCIGCCAGIMVALFAVGIMSLFWMGIAAVAILVEKTLPGGERFVRVLAVALGVLGVWLAVSPSSVPQVHQPGHARMQMGTRP